MATPEELRIRISALNESKKAFNEVNADLRKTSTAAKTTQSAVMGTSSGFSSMGRSAGQAGIQVQQLVGQIQGGTNPMLALSQQAADLGFVLGAPLLGAVAGLAASFAMVLLPALFETKDSVEDVIDLMDELNDSTVTLTANQKRLKEQVAQTAIDEYREKIADLKDDLLAFRSADIEGVLTENDEKRIVEINAQIDTYTQKIDNLKKGITELNDPLNDNADALDRMIERLKEEADTLGMTSTQIAIYRAQKEGATQAQLESIRTFRGVIDQYEAEQELARQLSDELAKIDEAREEYAENHRKQQEEMAKNAEAALKANMQSLKPLEDGLVSLINGTKSTKDAFADMARSIVNDLIRIQIQQSITKPLAGLLGGGGIGGFFSNMFGGSSGATTTAVPPVPTFAGGGYTGSGPRSGGMDGKGGFPAMLHPNETVVDHTQGQTGGVTINQTINVTTGVQQTVRAEIMGMMPQIASASKQAVLDARRRGGSYAGAF